MFIVCIAILFATYVCGQAKIKSKNYISIGIESSLPVSLFGEIYSLGIGASGQENVAIGKKTFITFYAGYINYFLKNTYGGGSDAYIPLLGGIRHEFLKHFFVAFQSGVTFRSHGLGSTFTYSPGLGIRVKENVSILFKYTAQVRSAINSGAIGLRAAYMFGRRRI